MKAKLPAIFLALMILVLWTAVPCLSEEEQVLSCGDWQYVLREDGSAELIRYTGSAGRIDIPGDLNGHVIMAVRGNPFDDQLGRTKYSVAVPADHPYLETVQGVLFGKTDRKLICCPPSLELKSYQIPDGTEIIGASAFRFCGKLKSVDIPETVKVIEDWAFCACTSLKEASIPENVSSIGSYAFYNCNFGSLRIPDGVTCISEYAFAYCTSLKSVTIPAGVTDIRDHAFAFCTDLTSVALPQRLVSIGEKAFYDSGLKGVTVPSGVTSIGDGAFSACTNLTDITVSPDNSRYFSAGGVLFSRDGTVLIQYPCGRASGYYAVPEGVTELGNRAFCYSKLSAVEIPETVTVIGYAAFSDCTNLTKITIPGSVTDIGECAFECSSLRSIVIPDGVITIGDMAFEKCSELVTAEISASVAAIGVRVFSVCGALQEITVSPDNARYTSLDGILFSKDGTALIQYPAGKTDASCAIPESVAEIGHSAFSGCKNLKEIFIPESVTEIGQSAFARCENVKEIIIPEGVESIGDYAFMWCESLENVSVPASVVNIGIDAFWKCDSLTLLVTGGSYAEKYCTESHVPFRSR